MEIKIEILNIKELTAAYLRAPDVIKAEMRLALRISMAEVQRRARSEHRFRTRSGNLERSITTIVMEEWPPKGQIAIDPAIVRTRDGRNYGNIVHDGQKPHVIMARPGHALRWAGPAGFAYSRKVKHPGTAPDQFIYQAGNNSREFINTTFNRHSDEALRKAGIL